LQRGACFQPGGYGLEEGAAFPAVKEQGKISFRLSLGSMLNLPLWLVYALLSAFFAALTAIFAKAGLKDVNSDLATAVRTAVVLLITWGVVIFKNNAKGI